MKLFDVKQIMELVGRAAFKYFIFSSEECLSENINRSKTYSKERKENKFKKYHEIKQAPDKGEFTHAYESWGAVSVN